MIRAWTQSATASGMLTGCTSVYIRITFIKHQRSSHFSLYSARNTDGEFMLAATVFGGLDEEGKCGRLRQSTLAASTALLQIVRAEGNSPASDKTRTRAALKRNKQWKRYSKKMNARCYAVMCEVTQGIVHLNPVKSCSSSQPAHNGRTDADKGLSWNIIVAAMSLYNKEFI